MAVPKGKISKARGNSRYANWKLSTPNLVECPQCKARIKSHTVCPECGYYKGAQVVSANEKKD